MNTPETWQITMPSETRGRMLRIHKYDYREGYVKWCAICGDADEDHPATDHPFVEQPRQPGECAGCENTTNPDFHFGIYMTRVTYATFCTALCAYENGDRVYEEFND